MHTLRKTTWFYLCISLLFAPGINAQKINRPNIKGPGELQVNSYTGELLHVRNDLFIPGKGLPIDITFYYNSFNTNNDYGFGRGWSMTYSMKCIPVGNTVTVYTGDGRRVVYTQSGSTYIPPPGVFNSLFQYQPGK